MRMLTERLSYLAQLSEAPNDLKMSRGGRSMTQEKGLGMLTSGLARVDAIRLLICIYLRIVHWPENKHDVNTTYK